MMIVTKEFYLSPWSDKADTFAAASISNAWPKWLKVALPDDLEPELRDRLISNLKHIIVGLEMKAGLIAPHERQKAENPVLFAPYQTIMCFEFCVGTFSVCEGIGSAYWLRTNDPAGGAVKVSPIKWMSSLCEAFDGDGTYDLMKLLTTVKSVRDKLHQDKIGAREAIDWHSFSYEAAFCPALKAIQCLLAFRSDLVPGDSNLPAA